MLYIPGDIRLWMVQAWFRADHQRRWEEYRQRIAGIEKTHLRDFLFRDYQALLDKETDTPT